MVNLMDRKSTDMVLIYLVFFLHQDGWVADISLCLIDLKSFHQFDSLKLIVTSILVINHLNF